MIWIDTGHGQSNRSRGVYDPGASANGTTEAAEVRRIAAGVIFELEALGVEAKIAPDGYLADRIAWQKKNLTSHDWLFSLHLNAATPAATGVEVFYAGPKSHLRNSAEEMGRVLANVLDLKDRGAKPDNLSQHPTLGLLRASPAASMLAELGFITNTGDVTALRARGIKAVTEAICAVIDHPIVFQPSPEQTAAFALMVKRGVYDADTPKNQNRYETAETCAKLLASIGEVAHTPDDKQRAAFERMLSERVFSTFTAHTRKRYEDALIFGRVLDAARKSA